MFPLDGDTDLGSLEDSPLTGFPTPSSSHTHSIQSLHAKPQFNLDSAESLLASFRRMLVHYPCIVLMPEETVASLAATKPFVLLAILAAASGSRTLQGHTLYDEEFRKVLGLKFVAGGERSMNLLQGILIYCAWCVCFCHICRLALLTFAGIHSISDQRTDKLSNIIAWPAIS